VDQGVREAHAYLALDLTQIWVPQVTYVSQLRVIVSRRDAEKESKGTLKLKG